MRMTVLLLLATLWVAGCDQPAANRPVGSTENPPATHSSATDAGTHKPVASDNTAVNERDARANTKTPIDQKENQADIDVTAKIRKQVLDVKDMSVDGRNAKIITADGKVTLRGPVKTDEERKTIERIAVGVAGEGNVDNQLEVAGTTAVPR